MFNVLRLQHFVSHSLIALFHFLHGGLLTAGIVVTLFITGAASYGSLHDSQMAERIRQWGNDSGFMPAPQDLTTTESDAGKLSLSMQAVADHVAKRYRVARPAVKDIVLTAESTAKTAGLDPLLILAVIAVESGYNPYSESAFGAQGLMQVIGKYHTDKFDQTSNDQALLDTTTNIRVGVEIIREYLRRTGSIDSALQMYAGSPDDGDFVYANKVMAERNRLEQISQRGKPVKS